jgi:hypothetical protein
MIFVTKFAFLLMGIHAFHLHKLVPPLKHAKSYRHTRHQSPSNLSLNPLEVLSNNVVNVLIYQAPLEIHLLIQPFFPHLSALISKQSHSNSTIAAVIQTQQIS